MDWNNSPVIRMFIRTVLSTLSICAVLSATGLFLPSPSSSERQESILITQGIASGDVTDNSAIVWSRVNQEAQMNVEYDTGYNFSNPRLETAVANQTTDFAAKVKLRGLQADSLYFYRVWFTTHGSDTFDASNVLTGKFRTAPGPSASKQIDFVFGGDLGGGGFCRRIDSGYPIFSLMSELSPNFFVFNGDQIYADGDCPRDAPGIVIGWQNIEGNYPSIDNESVKWTDLQQLHNIYLRHWEYNRNDIHLQKLLQNTPYYSQFDDHEVIDDYGGNWSHVPGELKNRTGYNNLVGTGISLWANFSPIDLIRENDGHYQFYRSFHWGKSLDLFILDTRSYRSENTLIDTIENNKTLLGKEQLEWLKHSLFNSNGTWKVISTSNSITIPTCHKYGCDDWATNGTDNRSFVRERTELLKFLDDNNIENVVFIVTDVHFPANILVNQDFNADGDGLIFHELVSGPLSASPSVALVLDPTINATFLYKENRLFNFGHVRVNGPGELESRIIDSSGIVRPNSDLKLSPR